MSTSCRSTYPSWEGRFQAIAQYEHGNGGIFGRFTWRGDLLAGAWFLLREARNIECALISAVRGHPTGVDASKARLLGFWNGVHIPPREGFVSGAGLAQCRIELEDSHKFHGTLLDSASGGVAQTGLSGH